MKKSYGVIVFSVLFMLTGCLDSTSGTKFSLQGTGVDGYFKEATVCVDANENRACDSDETSTTTDENGDFTLPSINGSVRKLYHLKISKPNSTLLINKPITIS